MIGKGQEIQGPRGIKEVYVVYRGKEQQQHCSPTQPTLPYVAFQHHLRYGTLWRFLDLRNYFQPDQ